MTIKTSTDILKEHFETLKEALPDIYDHKPTEDTSEQKLFTILKRTLTIVEAVYLQEKDMFHAARIEEYSKIIGDLRSLGYDYPANKELMKKAAAFDLMKAKLPMEKAKGTKSTRQDSSSKKVG